MSRQIALLWVVVVTPIALSGCRVGVNAGTETFEHGIALPAPLSDGADGGVVVFDGNFDLSANDLSALNGVQLITGDLRLEGLEQSELVHFELQQVDGDVVISGSDTLTLLNLGQLQRIGGALRIENNTALTSVNLSRVQEVGGVMALSFDAALNFINLDGLGQSGGLRLATPALRALTLPRLARLEGDLEVGAEVFGGTDVLRTLALPALRSVKGSVRVLGNPALRQLHLPALESVLGVLVIAANPVLDTAELSALSSVEQAFCLCDNPLLPQCAADAVVAGLQVAPSQSRADGNNPSGVCQ